MASLLRFPWSRDRREHSRDTRPGLTLMVGARRIRALDWSLGGCRIARGAVELKLRDRLEGTVALEGERRRGEFVAEVNRITEGGEIGLRWLELSGTMLAAMAALGVH